MKSLLIPLVLLASLLLYTPIVSAQVSTGFNPLDKACENVPTEGPNGSSVCAEKNNTADPLSGTSGVLLRAARFISMLTGIASVIIIVFGSIKYTTSSGNPEAAAGAKKTITYALIGLVVALMAQGIIIFVINRIE